MQEAIDQVVRVMALADRLSSGKTLDDGWESVPADFRRRAVDLLLEGAGDIIMQERVRIEKAIYE